MAVEAVGKHQRRGCHSVNPLWLEASHWQQSVKVPVSTTYTTLRCFLSACEPGTVLSPGVKWGIACFEKFKLRRAQTGLTQSSCDVSTTRMSSVMVGICFYFCLLYSTNEPNSWATVEYFEPIEDGTYLNSDCLQFKISKKQLQQLRGNMSMVF